MIKSRRPHEKGEPADPLWRILRGNPNPAPQAKKGVHQVIRNSGVGWVLQEDGSQTHPYGKTCGLYREESVATPAFCPPIKRIWYEVNFQRYKEQS